jgi:outer membrane protein assembly factor BamB
MITRIFAVVAAAYVLDGSASSDPAMFRGGPAHTGIYESSTTPSLRVTAWKFKTGAKILSSPLVYGDAVYIGSADHNLYAVDRFTGQLKWKFETRGPVNSSPAAINGIIYAASVDGRLYAVDA